MISVNVVSGYRYKSTHPRADKAQTGFSSRPDPGYCTFTVAKELATPDENNPAKLEQCPSCTRPDVSYEPAGTVGRRALLCSKGCPP